MSGNRANLVQTEIIENKIYLIRGRKVMLDHDLAKLYDIPIKRLNEQVKRNLERFPVDFMFQLSKEETGALRSQFATSKKGRGGRRYLPYVFTQEGVAMLSSVLHSRRAIAVNIQIMRVFVKLRQWLASHKELTFKLKDLEGKVDRHDESIGVILEVIKQLMAPPEPEPEKPKAPIGFRP